jgi:hypothetical protein
VELLKLKHEIQIIVDLKNEVVMGKKKLMQPINPDVIA